MRIILSVVVMAAAPLAVVARQPEKPDPADRTRIEVIGCVKGSTLSATNLRLSSTADGSPSRRWRLRGSKELMKQLKRHSGRELEIVGSSKDPDSAMVTGGKRIGKSNIYIGGGPISSARDPLPDLPTIDVESFSPTGEMCR